MGMIMIGGLVTSTVLTLAVVPVVYSLVDDATLFTQRLLVRAFAALRRSPRVERSASAR
jgi:hypothetical protein